MPREKSGNFVFSSSWAWQNWSTLEKSISKGQLISKTNYQAEDSPKKRTNEFVFISMQHVLIRFLEESSARKKRHEIIWPLEPPIFIGTVKHGNKELFGHPKIIP